MTSPLQPSPSNALNTLQLDEKEIQNTVSSTDWRGLLQGLASELHGYKVANPMHDRSLLHRAWAALARPEPEVVGPSDEELLATLNKATADFPPRHPEAEALNSVEYPLALELRKARAVLARWGRPAPAPDDRGVLPMIVSETGADDEPELERIICASISGGADYVNNMPRELSLERITPEGSTFARYIQTDADTHLDGRPALAPAGEVVGILHVSNFRGLENSQSDYIADLPDGRYELSVRPSPAPAGEVGELVDLIRQIALAWEPNACLLGNMTAGQLTRAADPLEQRHPTPVPVAERLPGPEDCDAEGRVWVAYKPPESQATIFWELAPVDEAMEWAPVDSWLPATALPLPQGEVQP